MSLQHPPPPPADGLDAETVALVRDEYGVHLESTVRLRGGYDENAALWRAGDGDGHTYVLKRSRGSLTAGLVAADHLAQAGIVGIEGPLATRSGALSLGVGGQQLAVFRWVSGRGGTERPLGEASWRGFGRLMAAIHGLRSVVALERSLPAEAFRPAAAARVQALGTRVRQLPVDELGRQVRSDWEAAADIIAAVTGLAEWLGQELQSRPRVHVLTHGDCHLFNVVVADDEQVWLIDWVDAALAPPERDLIHFLGGILSDAPLSPAEERWFFEGYGPVDIDVERLAYYQAVRALEDLEWAEQALDRDRPVAERSQALTFFRGVLSPTGMVRRALSTVERR